MAETPEERNRLKAVLEVVESEKTYVKDLRTMIEVTGAFVATGSHTAHCHEGTNFFSSFLTHTRP